MKYLSYQSTRVLNKFVSNELLYFKYRILLGNVKLNPVFKYHFISSLFKLQSSRVRFKRRCVVTGFNRSFRRLSYSRITFREFASYGYFNGMRKSSW
jgi:ribosomal protein S14